MFTEKEKEILKDSLNMKRCYIETGNVSLSVGDVQSMGEEIAKGMGAKIKPLSSDQMRIILSIEEINEKLS